MATTSLLGLAVRQGLADLAGSIVGRTKALKNLKMSAYIFSKLKSITSYDYGNLDSSQERLTARDIYGLRNLRSPLQAQINSFNLKIAELKTILSTFFSKSQAEATVATIIPLSGASTDLKLEYKSIYQYDGNGNPLTEFSKENITMTPISSTECYLDLGTTNGGAGFDYVFVAGKYLPRTKTGPEEAIYDFDSLTIEWKEGPAPAPNTTDLRPVKKRENMQISGPFPSSSQYYGEFEPTNTGGGRIAYVLRLCRGTGDTFASLLAASVIDLPCVVLKKQSRRFGCLLSHTVAAGGIASISRTNNIATIQFVQSELVLGDPDLPSSNVSDNRILKGQPLIIRASGQLSDFAGSFVVASVDRKNRRITFVNVSKLAPTIDGISNPKIELVFESFLKAPLTLGDTVSMTFIARDNNANVYHYTNMVVGEAYSTSANTRTMKGVVLIGDPSVDYIVDNYYFDAALGSWGTRKAACISNFPSSELKGASKVFTARSFIRGFSSLRTPSVTSGQIIGTSSKSFWNRTTPKVSGSILNISFPGEVQINGSLEVKSQISFGQDAVLSKYPVSLYQTSAVSPYYEYFNKEKTLTHFFVIKVGGETCYLPANSFEDQVFKYEQNFISKLSPLSQTAIVALDKFYTAGNYFGNSSPFPKGGSWQSSTNTTNIFFGELFQPLVKSSSSPYYNKYANVMPSKEAWEAMRPLPKHAVETVNPSLNTYFESMPATAFDNLLYTHPYSIPTFSINSGYNSLYAAQEAPSSGSSVIETSTVMPTNAGTFFMVFKIRNDYNEVQPEGFDATTPQVIACQGVDWNVVSHTPGGSSSAQYFTDNGVGWFLYAKGYDGQRSICFTNPGPWIGLMDKTKWSSMSEQPVRKAGFSEEIVMGKKLEPNNFYFVALTFETRGADGNILSDFDMNESYTAKLTPSAYPNLNSSYLPSTAAINALRFTTVRVYGGSGTAGVVDMLPSQNQLKIIRTCKTVAPSATARFSRRLAVGLSVDTTQKTRFQQGWTNGGSRTTNQDSFEKFRFSCPMDVALVGQIDDVMNEQQLASLYSSLRTGTFKDLSWGASPV